MRNRPSILGATRHTVHLRYLASVEVDYAAGEILADEAHQALTVAINEELAGMPRIPITDLAVTFRRSATLTVEAILAGADRGDLTSPLDALTCLNTALNQALLRVGLFEEFDLARKRLTASPV